MCVFEHLYRLPSLIIYIPCHGTISTDFSVFLASRKADECRETKDPEMHNRVPPALSAMGGQSSLVRFTRSYGTHEIHSAHCQYLHVAGQAQVFVQYQAQVFAVPQYQVFAQYQVVEEEFCRVLPPSKTLGQSRPISTKNPPSVMSR